MTNEFLIRLACIVLSLVSVSRAQEPVVLNSATPENLRGLSVASADVVWASGTHGTYLRTTDAGKSWAAAQVPGAGTLDFRDVQAFSASLAYLLAAGPGEQSRIYKTSDGGQHWAPQFTNHDPQGFLDCMAFWDSRHGIVLGDPVGGKFTLLATKDGGRHWTPLTTSPAAIEGEGAFAASGTCIAVARKNHVWFATGGTAARVFHSTDRGKTWSMTNTPLPHSNASSGIFSIAFADPAHGAIAGGDYKSPEQGSTNLALTNDGGRTWQPSPLSPQGYFSAIALFADSKGRSHGIVSGTARAAFADDLEATKWKMSWPLNLNAVAFDPQGNAFAVGPKGAIIGFPLSH